MNGPVRFITPAALVLVGLIHLLPVTGIVGSEALQKLYGIPVAEPNLEILMRHRAALFGLLGAFMVLAAFKPALQAAALVAGLVSVGSFLLLAWSIGQYNGAIGRVVVVDLIAVAVLFLGSMTYLASRRARPGG